MLVPSVALDPQHDPSVVEQQLLARPHARAPAARTSCRPCPAALPRRRSSIAGVSPGCKGIGVPAVQRAGADLRARQILEDRDDAVGTRGGRRGCGRTSPRASRACRARNSSRKTSTPARSARRASRACRRPDLPSRRSACGAYGAPAYNRIPHAPSCPRHRSAIISTSSTAGRSAARDVRAEGLAAGLPLVEPETARLLRSLVLATGAHDTRDWHGHRLLGALDGAGIAARTASSSRSSSTRRARPRRASNIERAGLPTASQRHRRRRLPVPAQGGGAVRSDLPGRRQDALRAAARSAGRTTCVRAACS